MAAHRLATRYPLLLTPQVFRRDADKSFPVVVSVFVDRKPDRLIPVNPVRDGPADDATAHGASDATGDDATADWAADDATEWAADDGGTSH